ALRFQLGEDAIHEALGIRYVVHLQGYSATGDLDLDRAVTQNLPKEAVVYQDILNLAEGNLFAVGGQDQEDTIAVDQSVGRQDEDGVGPIDVGNYRIRQGKQASAHRYQDDGNSAP